MKPGFLKVQRGQTSIEIAMVTGVIFLIVISAFPYLTEVNVMNKGVSAARDGATFSQTMLNMGYSPGGVSPPQAGEVLMEGISYEVDTTTEPGTKIVTITLSISGTTDADIATEIKNQAGNYIFYSFNGEWNTSTNGTVVVGDYRFIVSHAFV